MGDRDGETMNELSNVTAKESTAEGSPAAIPFVLPVSKTKSESDPAVRVVLDDVQGIVWRVISSSRAAGRDYVDQCRLAAQAVVAVRPDLSVQDTLKAIFRLREQDDVAETALNAA